MLKLQLRQAHDSTYRTFLLRTMFAAGTLLDRMRIESGKVHNVDVRRVTLHSTTLRHLELEKISMNEVTATQCTVEFVNLIDAQIEDCTFTDSRISVGGTSYNFDRVTTTGSRWRFGGNRFDVENFQARASEITLDTPSLFSNVRVSDSSTVILGSACALLGDYAQQHSARDHTREPLLYTPVISRSSAETIALR